MSLHCPLTPATDKLVNAERLGMMKPSAYLINTSRGPLVDEAALAEALNSGGLAGAGLDVLSIEPPPADNPLLAAKNCYITPHIAWATPRRPAAAARSGRGERPGLSGRNAAKRGQPAVILSQSAVRMKTVAVTPAAIYNDALPPGIPT